MVYDLKTTTMKMALELASAEQLVAEAKERGNLVQHQITEKLHKKSDTTWYEVKLVEEVWKSKDILDSFVTE